MCVCVFWPQKSHQWPTISKFIYFFFFRLNTLKRENNELYKGPTTIDKWICIRKSSSSPMVILTAYFSFYYSTKFMIILWWDGFFPSSSYLHVVFFRIFDSLKMWTEQSILIQLNVNKDQSKWSSILKYGKTKSRNNISSLMFRGKTFAKAYFNGDFTFTAAFLIRKGQPQTVQRK